MEKHTSTGNLSTKNHDIVARTLKNALTLGQSEAWGAFSTIAAARLDYRDKAALAFSALQAQTPDHAEMTADAAINGTVCATPSSFIDTPAGSAAIVAYRQERDRRRAR